MKPNKQTHNLYTATDRRLFHRVMCVGHGLYVCRFADHGHGCFCLTDWVKVLTQSVNQAETPVSMVRKPTNVTMTLIGIVSAHDKRIYKNDKFRSILYLNQSATQNSTDKIDNVGDALPSQSRGYSTERCFCDTVHVQKGR